MLLKFIIGRHALVMPWRHSNAMSPLSSALNESKRTRARGVTAAKPT
jgi:hypothetical protein